MANLFRQISASSTASAKDLLNYRRGASKESVGSAASDPFLHRSSTPARYGPGSPKKGGDGENLFGVEVCRSLHCSSPGPGDSTTRGRRRNNVDPRLNSARVRQATTTFTAFSGAASEVFTFPHPPDCAHCADLLLDRETRWGTGLCDDCYQECEKSCKICTERLGVQELKWYSGLCNRCFDKCEKSCHFCPAALEYEQMYWQTGLCDKCYDQEPKHCHICKQFLTLEQHQWHSGLCDPCYDSYDDKTCKVCKNRLAPNNLRWGAGLCDPCYEASDKDCKVCNRKLAFAQLHYRSGICDDCYNKLDKICRKCAGPVPLGQLHWRSGLCDPCYNQTEKICKNCKETLFVYDWSQEINVPLTARLEEERINRGIDKEDWQLQLAITNSQGHEVLQRSVSGEERYLESLCRDSLGEDQFPVEVKLKLQTLLPLECLHWNSGLCDECYDNADKTCQLCKDTIKDDQLGWGSGLCDSCWGKSETTCTLCAAAAPAGQRYWCTGICDKCYNNLDKICKLCKNSIPFGSLRWGTGVCNDCYDECGKACRKCKTPLGIGQRHWGAGLCDGCYDRCEKKCRACTERLPFGQLHWATGYCDPCWDKERSQSTRIPERAGLKTEVWTVIVVQLVFYMAPGLVNPALFLEVKAMFNDNMSQASGAYALILTTASVVAMAAPVPLGLWAEWRGEREVYVGVSMIAGLSGLALGAAGSTVLFAVAWGALNAPPAIRGVRAVHFARNVKPEDLSRAGQLASSAGLVGGVLGPVAATMINRLCDQWPTEFTAFQLCAGVAAVAHLGSALALHLLMPPRESSKVKNSSPSDRLELEVSQCSECEETLSEDENRYRSALCNKCYDTYGGEGKSFKIFKWHVLLITCIVAGFLELSMNAGVLATFQPIATSRLGWTSDDIACVQVLSAFLSVIVSLASAQLRLPEQIQTASAAGLYCAGVLLFTMPPLTSFSCIAGLVFGLKAQILFMAPFTSIFSRLIGRQRVTNRLTISLCLAPAVGGAVGTVMSPLFLSFANTVWFMLAGVPAVVAFIFLLLFLHRMDGSW